AQAMLQDQLAISDDDLDELESLWNDPEAREEFADTVASVFGDGAATIDAAGRQEMITFLTENTELSEAEAAARVDPLIERYEEAQEDLAELEDDVRIAGQDAADALSVAAMWAGRDDAGLGVLPPRCGPSARRALRPDRSGGATFGGRAPESGRAILGSGPEEVP
ncbi:MAG: hypothetical protein ABR510_14855, partial [Trueperaceae bacterium]